MKWCNPCALVWVVILSALASHIWLNIHWTYYVAAAVVLVPVAVAAVKREGEDIYFTLQGIVTEVWWLMKNRSGPETIIEILNRGPLTKRMAKYATLTAEERAEYDAIQAQEAEIGRLSAIKNKPRALKKQLEDMQKGIDDLVALVDQRDGGDAKPGTIRDNLPTAG